MSLASIRPQSNTYRHARDHPVDARQIHNFTAGQNIKTLNPTDPVLISCSCCGGTSGNPVHRGLSSVYSSRLYDVVRCSVCRNLITMPIIQDEELQQLYSRTYLYPIHRLAQHWKRNRARRLARFIRQLAPATKYKSLLEVGCMFGYLMEELRSNYLVKGIEIGTQAVRHCQARGLDAAQISLESYLQTDEATFDIIIMSHVLEHLRHPDKDLQKLRDRLNPGGVLVILVPNHDSISARLFGRYWGWWQVPVHFNHFNRSALEHLARRSGYHVNRVRY